MLGAGHLPGANRLANFSSNTERLQRLTFLVLKPHNLGVSLRRRADML